VSSFLTVHQHILGYFVPSDGVPKMSPCFSEMGTHFGEDIHRRRLGPTGIPGNSYALNLRRDSRKFLQRCMQGRRGLAMRILSVCLSVRPSVRPSDKRVDCDKTEERSVQIFIPFERATPSA